MVLRGWKKLLMLLLVLTVFASAAAGVAWNLENYVLVDFRFYPREARSLDLRDRQISVRHYDKLSRALPDCEIAWNVPFQDTAYPQDTKEITLTQLSDKDIDRLDYFRELETIQADGCQDFALLLKLEEKRPEVALHYTVSLGQETYSRTGKRIDVKNLPAEELPRLACFPNLHTVVCSGGTPDQAAALESYCAENALKFCIGLGGRAVSLDVEKLTLTGTTEWEATLIPFLEDLEELRLKRPEAPVEVLQQLQKDCPDLNITWEQEICGEVFTSEDKEIDLSGADIDSIAQIQAGMTWFPEADQVFLGLNNLDNDDLAAYRDQVRQDYKVVWTVRCGEKLTARTDDTTFMPVRSYVYYFNDEEAYNLRYCEEMVCIDIGHMSIHNIDFVEYMPDLTYLVLAHTQLQDISPIGHCKKLKFLELDWTPLKDYSPLLDCTALEDLNLGNTFGDFTPIGKMTWLKNLWMIGCSRNPAYRMTEALPDTTVMISGSATVANGWRKLENYYDMRDLLGMEYMSW